MLATANGMAIRFSEADARPMGRNTSGVKGITLGRTITVVGMVVADPEATLLTVCANGYGKRTPFGPNAAVAPKAKSAEDEADDSRRRRPPSRSRRRRRGRRLLLVAAATARSAAAARACATSRPPSATAR